MDKTVERIAVKIKAARMTLAVAESFTGGGVSSRLTALPGASEYFTAGLVCYANKAKIDYLGIDPEILRRYGAVSRETAAAMVNGLNADFRLATTGNAGPAAEREGERGRCFVAAAFRERSFIEEHFFTGDRATVTYAGVEAALRLLLQTVEKFI